MSQLLSHPHSLIIIFFLLLSPIATSHARDPHIINFRSPGLYPEGLTYDPSSHHFIVASLRRQTFHSVSDAGVSDTLISSGDVLPTNSTILGLAVDNRHRRLLVAVNSETLISSSSFLASFDLRRSSIRLLFLSPLPSSSADAVANDVAVDPYGNAYVTNSGENLIWKVDQNGTASVLSNSPLFNRYPVDHTSRLHHCGLNGVVYIDSKGYLLVVQSNTGRMFKVDAVDGTARAVILPEEMTGADGIAVRDDGVVVVVSVNCAWFLKSDDSWAQGVVIDKIALDEEGYPTSVALGGGRRVYVVYGYVDEGMEGNVGDREWFRIEELRSRKESEGESVWPFVLIGLGLAYFLFWRFQMAQLVKNMDKKQF